MYLPLWSSLINLWSSKWLSTDSVHSHNQNLVLECAKRNVMTALVLEGILIRTVNKMQKGTLAKWKQLSVFCSLLNISEERFHLNHYARLLQSVLFSFGRGQRVFFKEVFSGSKSFLSGSPRILTRNYASKL